MSALPHYTAAFSLLYADPEVAEQRSYLQPLYGQTAPDDPPVIFSTTGDHLDAATGVMARPPRAVPHSQLSLYPDLSTDIVGPQPVYGGAAVEDVDDDPAPSSSGYLFDVHGAPLLSSIIEDRQLKALQRTRTPYPAPKARSGQLLLTCTDRASLILFGGLGDGPFNDFWEYDTASGRWHELVCTAAEPPRAVAADAGGAAGANGGGESAGRGVESATGGGSATSSSAEEEEEYSGDDAGGGAILDGSSNRSNGDDLISRPLLNEARSCGSHMPPPAYGQAGTLYHDQDGDPCMMVTGGISTNESCCGGVYSLNLNTKVWSRLETTLPLQKMWGATAQTLLAPRRVASGALPQQQTRGNDAAGEEEVVVLFGGMTGMGTVTRPTTRILHLDHRLTEEEVHRHAEVYLSSVGYDDLVLSRIMAIVFQETALNGETSGVPAQSDIQSSSIRKLCTEWSMQHADVLEAWRCTALRSFVGKYWVEQLPDDSALQGRRRPCSAVYKNHFMFIFGGRDDGFFYNDLWALNIKTRAWVQIREGIPNLWLQKFFDEPDNASIGALIQDRGARVRSDAEEEVRRSMPRSSTTGAVNPILFARNRHEALYSCPSNSSARPRTGACMVMDPLRDCLYIYGGFAHTRLQQLTYYDLHAYHITEHRWRRVALHRERLWDAATDAAAATVGIVKDTEEARLYSRRVELPQAVLANGDAPSRRRRRRPPHGLPYTPVEYIEQYMRFFSSDEDDDESIKMGVETAVAAQMEVDGAALPRVPRGRHRDLQDRTAIAPGDSFVLPVTAPEARTMAAMAEDPLHPGRRFYLHGGRSGEEARGDFYQLQIFPCSRLQEEYVGIQRAAASSPPTASDSVGADSLDTTQHVPAAGGGDAAVSLQHASLQSRLRSAALERRGDSADGPAAWWTSEYSQIPRRRTLRGAAVGWMRDALDAVDRKALMLVELRNGRALIDLRSHSHEPRRAAEGAAKDGDACKGEVRRLQLNPTRRSNPNHTSGMEIAKQSTGASCNGGAGSSNNEDKSNNNGGSSSRSSSSESLAMLNQMDDQLPRAAAGLESLLYDVLLSQPASPLTNPGCSADTATQSSRPMPSSALCRSIPESTDSASSTAAQLPSLRLPLLNPQPRRTPSPSRHDVDGSTPTAAVTAVPRVSQEYAYHHLICLLFQDEPFSKPRAPRR